MCCIYSDSDSGSEDEELELPLAQNGKCKPLLKRWCFFFGNILKTLYALSHDDSLSGKATQKEKAIADKSNAAKALSLKKSDAKPSKPSKDEDDSEDDDDSDEDEDFDDESDEV